MTGHNAEQRAARAESAINRHLPTIIDALYQLIDQRAEIDGELDDRELTIRAGYSAAHSIAKEAATGRHADAVYDLPSVLDLNKLVRTWRTRAERAEEALQRVREAIAAHRISHNPGAVMRIIHIEAALGDDQHGKEEK